MTPGGVDRIRPLFYAVVAVLLAFTWQALTVRYNYAGNWTGLFCTGGNLSQPPSLAAEHIYNFANGYGYDGQYYHYVAHDPLFRNGLNRYIDAPRLRYRRILMPALARLVAAGRARYIDSAYIAGNLLALFAGVYWLGRFLGIYGFHPASGLSFLIVPATVVSLDRLTVDMALAALCIGFALYVAENQPRKLYLVLLLAPLARETGLLLIGAYCLSELTERRFRRAALFATSAVPTLGWYAFVQSRTSGYSSAGWFTPVPLAGLIREMSHPVHYPSAPAVALATDALDELALAGMLLGFIVAFWLIGQKWPHPLQFAVILIALGGLNFDQPFWIEAYSFGRVLSPLLVLIALFACQSRWWITLLPLAMIVPRIGLQMGGQVVKVAHGLFG
jgi:hypothetical protein